MSFPHHQKVSLLAQALREHRQEVSVMCGFVVGRRADHKSLTRTATAELSMQAVAEEHGEIIKLFPNHLNLTRRPK